MPKSIHFHFVIVVLLFTVSPAAFSQNASLTDKQFLNRGSGEFIGTIQSVHIISSNQYAESGMVEVQVNQVLSGTISVPTITFPFQRTLKPSDYLANWDLVVPLDTSLEAAIGADLLIFITENKGTFSIYPASNSVQVIARGLLVGKIVSVQNQGDDVAVEIQVSEMVYGWVTGTDVTFQLSKHLTTSAVKVGSPHEISGRANQDEQFIVAFINGKISAVEIASKEFLSTLKTVDSQ